MVDTLLMSLSAEQLVKRLNTTNAVIKQYDETHKRKSPMGIDSFKVFAKKFQELHQQKQLLEMEMARRN